jgi:hypothetical protein
MKCKEYYNNSLRATDMEVLRNIQAAGYNIDIAY